MRKVGMLALLTVLTAVVLAARWRLAATPAERVYSAMEIHTLLARVPSALEGRTVLVRGQALRPVMVALPVHCPPPPTFGCNELLAELPLTTIDNELGVAWGTPGVSSTGTYTATFRPARGSPTGIGGTTGITGTWIVERRSPPASGSSTDIIGAVRAALGSLPGLGRMAPRPQRLVWNKPETYRVRILSHRLCVLRDCYDALLLNAVSPDDAQIASDARLYAWRM